MSGIIYELLDVLKEESKLYDELVDLSKIKKDYVIKNDTDNLKELTSKENLMAGKIQRLERKRLSLIKDISYVLNEKESNITLASLANIISDKPESQELKNVAEHLKQTLSELKQLNEQNRVLIENALEYIDFSMNVIRSTFDAQPTVFSAKGEQITPGGNLFDAKN